MIYVDSSAVLAEILAEDRKPPEQLWAEDVVSSRLTTYEVWTRLHRLAVAESHGKAAGELLARMLYLEMTRSVLDRALHAFPTPLRTLDALHLASIEHLRSRGSDVSLMTYDRRMGEAAQYLGIGLWGEDLR